MKKQASAARQNDRGDSPRTLAIDVGGTGVKAMVLDRRGKTLTDRVRIPTPKRATPKALIAVMRKLAKRSGEFDRVAIGFPGVVKDGVVYSAANLGKGWNGFGLQAELERRLERPVRVANDADVQGLGCVTGRGLEMVITLGTGFGSVLFADGRRIHLELAHHPFHQGKTYEDELGHRALAKKGKKKWSRLLREAIGDLKQAFNYDRLYIGGGNSKFIGFKLPPEVTIVSNMDGLLGGIRLWEAEKPSLRRAPRRRPKSNSKKSASKKIAPEMTVAPPAPTPRAAAETVSPTRIMPPRTPPPAPPRKPAAARLAPATAAAPPAG
jgi:polyphosphate glucokinase